MFILPCENEIHQKKKSVETRFTNIYMGFLRTEMPNTATMVTQRIYASFC